MAAHPAGADLAPSSAGHGVSYNGLPLINPGGNKPIYFGEPTVVNPAPPTPLRPARNVTIPSGSPININLGYGNCRVDDLTTYVSCWRHAPCVTQCSNLAS